MAEQNRSQLRMNRKEKGHGDTRYSQSNENQTPGNPGNSQNITICATGGQNGKVHGGDAEWDKRNQDLQLKGVTETRGVTNQARYERAVNEHGGELLDGEYQYYRQR